MSQVEQMFGLRGDSLAAFRQAGDVIEASMRRDAEQSERLLREVRTLLGYAREVGAIDRETAGAFVARAANKSEPCSRLHAMSRWQLYLNCGLWLANAVAWSFTSWSMASNTVVATKQHGALRDGKGTPETLETLLREAHMRQAIRRAQKTGYHHVAVVCGAWHTPALAALEDIKASADAALLKGLKKVKTEATWIPWSFDRLATQSGYSAGIIAPAWYRLLFKMDAAAETNATGAPGENAVTQWLTQAARLLREQDLATSSAHVIEAVRLANTLAVLRRTAWPGIEELREAAVTVLCEGAEKQLELIDQQLIIGDVLGRVPDDLPAPPLKADFEAQVKSCRLDRKTIPESLELDLRKDAHTAKSRLLHRLGMLGISWGQIEVQDRPGRQGGFHEDWQLKWLPDFEIRLIEAGTWGNTVLEAATSRTLRQVRMSGRLPELTTLLGTTLKADLSALVPDLLDKMQSISALSNDVLGLADAVLPLAEVLRYGSARQLDLRAVEQLLGGIIPRVAVQLPTACCSIDEDVAADILKKLLAVNRALAILAVPDYETRWQQTLGDIAENRATAPFIGGPLQPAAV